MSQWALYKKAKSLGFTVLLGGLGGDELFYGYPEWNQTAESLKLKHIHHSLFPWKGTDRKIAFIRYMIKNWKYVLYAGYPYQINDKTTVPWTYNDYLSFASDGVLQYNDDTIFFNEIDVHQSFKDDKCEIDLLYSSVFETFMTTQCLYLADRQGMGNSTEIRSPFIDYKLVEFISTLPLEIKFKKNIPKYLLKCTLEGILPDYILHAQKKGFTPPLAFIDELIGQYSYKKIHSESKFFNSVLADRILNLHLQ